MDYFLQAGIAQVHGCHIIRSDGRHLEADVLATLRASLALAGKREFFGPGWRRYYVVRGGAIILMLGGGDTSQAGDIERAKHMAMELQDAQD